MSGKPWTQYECDILTTSYASAPFEDLTSRLCRSVSSIRQKARDIGLQRPHAWNLTAEDLHYLQEHWQNTPSQDLARYFQCRPQSVTAAARRLHLPKRSLAPVRTYAVPKNIFHLLAHDSAYILGYILADGCISRQKTVSITSTDRPILQSIREVLHIDNPIQIYNYETTGKAVGYQRKPCYRLTFHDRNTVQQLAVYGIGPRKSLTATLPPTEDAIFFDFLRGFFDGDGNVYIHTSRPRRSTTPRRAYLCITFASGSVRLMQQLAIRIATLTETSLRPVCRTSNQRGWILTYWNQQALTLGHRMYAHAMQLSLPRKQEVFQQYQLLLDSMGASSGAAAPLGPIAPIALP